MFRILGVLLALVLVLGLAFGEGEEGRQGNNACYGIQGVGGQMFANPGEMFQFIRDAYDANPAKWIEARQAETVGEFIYNRCVVHNPDAQ